MENKEKTGFLKFESNLEIWINNHAFLWILTLITISYVIGFLGTIFLGMSFIQSFFMGSVYAVLLTILELYVRSEK